MSPPIYTPAQIVLGLACLAAACEAWRRAVVAPALAAFA
jgi:hypothetical protein